MARDEQALSSAVEQSAALLTAAGFARMPSRVLMALLVADNGMTAAELGETLGASAAAISGAVRYLQNFGLIRRVSAPGSRRDRYEMPDDAWYSTMTKNSPLYGALGQLAEAAVIAMDAPGTAASHRVAEMAKFYRYLEQRMPSIIEEWEAQRSI
jgi:predicted transcriptional regulator